MLTYFLKLLKFQNSNSFEPPRDKTNKMTVRPAKTQISLGIRPVCSESSLSAWRKLGFLATHWAHSETLIRLGGCPGWSESSQGAHAILLVLSWGGSYNDHNSHNHSTMSQQQLKWAASWQNQQNDCAPSEDSDQPGHPPSLISLRCALNG